MDMEVRDSLLRNPNAQLDLEAEFRQLVEDRKRRTSTIAPTGEQHHQQPESEHKQSSWGRAATMHMASARNEREAPLRLPDHFRHCEHGPGFCEKCPVAFCAHFHCIAGFSHSCSSVML